ncbi:uncharacterized protein B0P05DRAFT_87896 [Gilbertella persicaria]|uniref:uncharacterized protein n=1 Tax=Gilbertella persicaria TaxID=101096 RepID=UPI0022205FEA|nr:uncharacterized protein B0P05DRAFT_87896 [Gilbertella persicaria]KAI8079601.1 hypothetical protein B0P05DRAFT_87896 [Gilbertella persicaria]
MPLQTYIIYPTHEFNRPTPPSKIALHGLDLLSAPIQIHHHRFYRSPPCPTTGVIDALKSSLAKALELYPPLTGKIITDEQGQQCIDMDPRHRMGTPFIVDTKDIPYTRDSENLSPRTDVILPPSSSILAVKVTLVNTKAVKHNSF